MAKAKKTKPRERLFRWRATLIKGTPAKFLGHVDVKRPKACFIVAHPLWTDLEHAGKLCLPLLQRLPCRDQSVTNLLEVTLVTLLLHRLPTTSSPRVQPMKPAPFAR